MWTLENHTPYAAAQTWIRDPEGAEVWIVAVKATYDVLPDGRTRVADEQVPVHRGPVPHPGAGSLRYETDLGPSKAATDVVLIGHAYAQGPQPVTELSVAWCVGPVRRAAKIHGDRFRERAVLGSSVSAPQPFSCMPLTYEHAHGGDSADAPHASGNPVGLGLRADAQGRVRLPNVESPESAAQRPDKHPAVVGFGVIAAHWPQRRRHAGTYDDAWLRERHPLPPQDLDPRHWQVAPAEQQVSGHLRGGEPVVLYNLTRPGVAAGGHLAFTLPRLSLALETRFYDGSIEPGRSVIHSVIVEPDWPRISVVHHMALPCHPKVNLLDRTIIREKRRPLDRAAASDAIDIDGVDDGMMLEANA